MKINNEKEKNAYYSKTIKEDGAYFTLTSPSGESEFVWVEKYEKWNDDGSDWYVEHSTLLNKHEISTYPYDTEHFLLEGFDIEYVTDDDLEAINCLKNTLS